VTIFLGLYGLMAWMVGRRTREIAIRTALARPPRAFAWACSPIPRAWDSLVSR